MSRKISLSSLSDEDIQTFNKHLNIEKESSKYSYYSKGQTIQLYDVEGDDLYIPFYYGKEYDRPSRKSLPEMKIEFTGTLRDEQKEVKKEAIALLNRSGSALIAAAPAFGKTCTSINIASTIGLKTLIVSNRIQILTQWEESIKKFTNASSYIIKGKKEIPDSDFYIINVANITKYDRSFYKKIGFVIVDEAHLILAEKLSSQLRYLTPRYLLGLSATPYRNDGLNILFDHYFGKDKIERKLWRRHTVYKINTGLDLPYELSQNNKINWSSLIKSQCEHIGRNELIISIIKKFKDRTFLVLCKRVEQAKYLVMRLKQEEESVTSLFGSQQKYEQTSRILIGTSQKCSTGFDHPLLNTMILASDVKDYFVQYLGRVFRRKDVEPVIFDIIDKHPILNYHFRERSGIYVEHGGMVKDFNKEFPDFLENITLE